MSAAVDQRVTITELLELRRLSDAELSADGRLAACTVVEGSAERGRLPGARVWVGAARGDGALPPAAGAAAREGAAGAAVRPATDGQERETLPRLSPDGRRLAFAADASTLRLLRLDDAGAPAGAPVTVARLPGEIEQLRWSRDGAQLLVLVAEDPALDAGAGAAGDTGSGAAGAAGAGADEPLVLRPGGGWRRLHRVELASGAVRAVGPRALNVWEVDWNGGDAVAIVSDEPGESAWYDARVALLDLVAGSARTLHVPQRQLQSPTLAADGRRVAFVEGLASDRGEVAGVATVVEVAPPADAPADGATPLPTDCDLTTVRWLNDGSLFGAGQRGLEGVCVRLARDGVVTELWRGAATLGRASAVAAACSADGGRLLAAKEAPGEPPELALLDLGADAPAAWRELTAVNAALAGRAVPSARRFAWSARDGQEIEGVLLLPPDAAPADAAPADTAPAGAAPAGAPTTSLPLVVLVHGGPANAWSFDYAPGAFGLALAIGNAGCAVLLPNPRGSTGRGQAFAAANLGDLGGEDLHDLLRGVDALEGAGVADPARVAISGISYGGFMSAWAITQSDRFAAAIPFACVADWLSFHHTSEIPAFDELFLASDPADAAAAHVARSPVTRARGARTPTLIFHGADDRCAPAGQSRELYQALVAAGCETELVVYPRGGHRWWERDHLRDTFARTLAWLERHLGLAGAGR